MADVDPALGQEILDVAQRQRISHVHHHDQTDDLRRAVKISERVAHGPSLPQPEASPAVGLTEPALGLGVIGIFQNLIVLWGVSPNWTQGVSGLVLIAAMTARLNEGSVYIWATPR
jgi:hypothetical protein